MKAISIKRIISAGAFALATTAIALIGFAASAAAEVYDGNNTQPTKVPTFNSITKIPTNGTGVPSTGNEPDFFEGAVTGSGQPFTDPVIDACANGTVYTFRVYVHNNASDLENNNGNGPSVAHGTKVKVNLPTAASNSLVSKATISATNAATVSDNLTLNCGNKKVSLSYVAGSASQYSEAGGDQKLSDKIVTSGALIGTEKPNGDMWGCWHQRVWVTLKVVVNEEESPSPVYTCDLLTMTKQGDRTYQFKVNYTATGGAKFKKAVVDFGDGSKTLTTTERTFEHTYVKDGDYKVKTTLTFTVDGKDYQVSSDKCAAMLNVKTPTPPTLPETGAAGGVAIFALVATIFGAGHYFIRSRAS